MLRKKQERIKSGIRLKAGMVCSMILIIMAAIIGFEISRILNRQKTPEITVAYISEKINSVSDLITAELEYSGLVIYTEGEIPFLTQKGFSMRYMADIYAGIDISEMQIAITEEEVTVTVPSAEIQSINVRSDSIEFYDEKYALFNWTEKEDVVDAIAIAEEDAAIHADRKKLLEKADHQIYIVLNNILTEAIGKRRLIINQK